MAGVEALKEGGREKGVHESTCIPEHIIPRLERATSNAAEVEALPFSPAFSRIMVGIGGLWAGNATAR